MSIGQVLISRTFTVYCEVAERLKADVCSGRHRSRNGRRGLESRTTKFDAAERRLLTAVETGGWIGIPLQYRQRPTSGDPTRRIVRCRGRLVCNLRQTVHSLLSKNGGVSSDRGFGHVSHARRPTIQCGDELAEPACHVGEGYRHGTAPLGRSWRRPTFHISPHRSQRQ